MTGQKLMLKNVRLMFTQNLFKAGSYKNQDGPKKFKCKFAIEKTDPQVATLQGEIMRLAKEQWPDKAAAIIGSIKGNPMKFCLADGDLKDHAGYAGTVILSAGNSIKPILLQANPGTASNPNLVTEESGILYSGCYVNASVSFWTYVKDGPGLYCNLEGVQFNRKGEAFAGGSVASASEFGNGDEALETVGAAADSMFT